MAKIVHGSGATPYERAHAGECLWIILEFGREGKPLGYCFEHISDVLYFGHRRVPVLWVLQSKTFP